MPYIELKNLSFPYEKDPYKKPVLSQLSLSIPIGQRTALFAPSGWGKTTLLLLLAGLLTPERGSISYPLECPGFSMIFQENRLIENASIQKNLSFVQKNLTVEQMQCALAAVSLSHPLSTKIRSLSGGEKRRVSILRALCANYDILLMDEPFTGLDPDTRQSVVHYIRRETEEKTVILVTHSMEEVKALDCHILPLSSL